MTKFVAPNIEAIHQWYAKCLELGGIDNGAPGPRPEYHPGYYGAFIVDPNGWRIEIHVFIWINKDIFPIANFASSNVL